MGGDHGCQVVVEGMLQALEQHSQIENILVVGDKSQLGQALGRAGKSDSRIEIIHAPEILTMDDKPVEGLRRKKNCSLAVAMDLVKRGDADAIISPATPAAWLPLPRSSCAPCRESIAPVLPRSARGTTATLSCSTPVPVWTANPGISCTTPSWATFTPGKYWAFPDQGWAC